MADPPIHKPTTSVGPCKQGANDNVAELGQFNAAEMAGEQAKIAKGNRIVLTSCRLRQAH
jgi:hypothetical protein